MIASSPLASSAASASHGTAPARSRSITSRVITSATAWAASTASSWLRSTCPRYATTGTSCSGNSPRRRSTGMPRRLRGVSYTTAEGRQQLLDDLAEAIGMLAIALAELGDAYEQLDERTADTLEEQLFRPLQLAYGRAQRAHGAFAARAGLAGRTFAPAPPGAPSTRADELVENAVERILDADEFVSELQDSLLPVEVGDREIRGELSGLREALDPLPRRARELTRTLGR